ncbi:enoyl-ACP reductase FabI [Microvirga calopogonii]|uniref:enoyl-ACP reductase FabI n=1 Tax=Microvirga calopogonii TaxID=2078013 RepID=UPI001FE0DE39|nr:enoyl-ACP reductase FabI [Microvirga calopogonii]
MKDRPNELSKAAIQSKILHGKKVLVVGIANEHSIAYGCARVFRELGADLAVTYLNEKAKPFVEPLAEELGAAIFAPCDVAQSGQLEGVFEQIRTTWGSLDIALHSIAFAPKEDLQGRLVDSSDEGFKVAMDISCHSFIRMARLAEPLMKEGGTLLAMSYHGADKVVPNYNLMGPVKAALESAVRYLAYELGHKHIRVHAVSPGPLKTQAASGLIKGLLACSPDGGEQARPVLGPEGTDFNAAPVAQGLGGGVVACLHDRFQSIKPGFERARYAMDRQFPLQASSVREDQSRGPNREPP